MVGTPSPIFEAVTESASHLVQKDVPCATAGNQVHYSESRH